LGVSNSAELDEGLCPFEPCQLLKKLDQNFWTCDSPNFSCRTPVRQLPYASNVLILSYWKLPYCASYQTEGNRYAPSMQYYEELYDISLTPNELNFIEISVETTTEYTIQKALENPDVLRFFASLDE